MSRRYTRLVIAALVILLIVRYVNKPKRVKT